MREKPISSLDVEPSAQPDVLEEQTPGLTRRRSVRYWLTVAAVIALLAAVAIQAARARAELANLQRLSLGMLIGTCALQFVSQMLLNAALLLPLRTCMDALGFWELYVVRTGGLFVGGLVPVAGGLAVRLAYLRRRGLTYVDFMWATLFSNVLALAASAVVAAAATGFLWMMVGHLPAPVLGVSAALFAISLAAVAVFEFLPRLARYPVLRKWRWLAGISSLQTSRRMAIWVSGFSLIRQVVNFVTFGLLCQALSQRPGDFLSGGLVYALTSPIRMVVLTPGNLGITEWFVALVGKILAFNLITGLMVAFAFRGVALVAQGLGAVFGSAWLALGKKSS